MFSALFVAVGIVVASTLLVTNRRRKRPARENAPSAAERPQEQELNAPGTIRTPLEGPHGLPEVPSSNVPLEDAPDLNYDDVQEEDAQTQERTAERMPSPIPEVPQTPAAEGSTEEEDRMLEELLDQALDTPLHLSPEITIPGQDLMDEIVLETPQDMDLSTLPVIEVTTFETPTIEDIQASVPANSTFEVVAEELPGDIEIPVPDSASLTDHEMISPAGDDDVQFVALTEQPEILLAPETPLEDDDMVPQDTLIDTTGTAAAEQGTEDTIPTPELSHASPDIVTPEALPDPGPVIPPADPGPPLQEEEARKVKAEICDSVPDTITIKKGVMPVSDIKNKVESLLFMAKMPLTATDLVPIVKEDKKIIEACLETIFNEYAQRALQIVRVAGGYQMATRPEYHDVVQRFVKSPVEVSLSAAAMETLAIVAYRQPVSRREVEHIRGVNSDATVKSLQDKGLIQELGKGDIPGKPIVFGTTDLFLRHFGLNDIKDLPPDPGMNYQLPFRKTITPEGSSTASAEIETSPSV